MSNDDENERSCRKILLGKVLKKVNIISNIEIRNFLPVRN